MRWSPVPLGPINPRSPIKNFGLSYCSSPLPWTEHLPFSRPEALERVIGWSSDCSQDPLSCHPFLEGPQSHCSLESKPARHTE